MHTKMDRMLADAGTAVLTVGEGRGFLVAMGPDTVVITAAYCLTYLPPPHPRSYTEERTYGRLLGPVGETGRCLRGACICRFDCGRGHPEAYAPGTSSSPVLDAHGRAVALVSGGADLNPLLLASLPDGSCVVGGHASVREEGRLNTGRPRPQTARSSGWF
jgi:hypothetical protein